MTCRQTKDLNVKKKKQYKNFKENQGNYKTDLGAGEIITKAGNPKAIKDHI